MFPHFEKEFLSPTSFFSDQENNSLLDLIVLIIMKAHDFFLILMHDFPKMLK